MPLFGSKRDSLLIKHFNKEVLHKWVSIEIAYFKLSLNDTNITIYNESSNRTYLNPVRLFSFVTKEEMTTNDVDTGIDITQPVTFTFLRDDLVDIDVVIEAGDIIKFDERYYEIDNVQSTQYWLGRNPQTLPIQTEGRSNYQFGYNTIIKCSSHLTRISPLNLVESRTGINQNFNIPRNL